MGLETVGFISDLVTTNPTGADDRSTSDDHHRVVKTALLNSFPNINGAVTATLAEINKLAGMTATQTELNLLAGKTLSSVGTVIDNFPTGTIALFQQNAAPSGWTKLTTHNDKALRIVSGTPGTGGTRSFSTIFTAYGTEGHALTIDEMPSHSHTQKSPTTGGATYITGTQGNASAPFNNEYPTDATGGGAEHLHSINLQVEYVDVILASKD